MGTDSPGYSVAHCGLLALTGSRQLPFYLRKKEKSIWSDKKGKAQGKPLTIKVNCR